MTGNDTAKISNTWHEYIRPGKAAVLVDGQYGSTGKGLLAAYLACQPQNEVQIAVTNASANAGHWTKFADPKKRDFCCFHLPTFGVIQDDCDIYIDAGAIINVDLFFQELEENKIRPSRIAIHPNAAVINDQDIAYEASSFSQATKIASTRKGVGRALSQKVQRISKLAKDHPKLDEFIEYIDLNQSFTLGARVSVEIPQGFSLSLNGPFYPNCTSRQCTVSQGLADAQVHPSFLGEVAMSVRTYPIRVGNIMEDGEQVGFSGEVYPDQQETSFSDLGVEEELTTVTKRVRRIFTWSDKQYQDAIAENRPTVLFLNFINYIQDANTMKGILRSISRAHKDAGVEAPNMLFGYGPNVEDVKP